MSELIPVELAGEYLEVHPTTFAAHEALGWRKCEKREVEQPSPTRADLEEALSRLPDDYNDPDFVVNGMRRHFGDVFTDADKARVRELVKPADKKPSDGLTVDELKAALTEKGIQFQSTALKADLQALLDGTTQPTE
ncbi:HeH/LEM domain-containing protein [Cupriavidus nantongensis]|uniref:HeH/LEM domain-containing protein n=1 Tax=Cupriavidus nantongensis TaxID=1796606 RepID=UPI00358E4B27